MPKPPRMVVLLPSRYAKPTRGIQFLYTGFWSEVLPFAAVVPYHMAPGFPVAGLMMFGSKERTLPLTSDQPVLPSQRSPMFRVSLGLTLKSSWTKTPGFFRRPPYSGEFRALQFWA